MYKIYLGDVPLKTKVWTAKVWTAKVPLNRNLLTDAPPLPVRLAT